MADSVLNVSWVRIVEEFSLRYDSVFLQTTAKAHLDYSSCIVDGAKDKWCQVVLLDTIIAFQEGLEPKISQQRRRQFNQYLAFRESIIVVASEAWISYIKSKKDENSCIIDNKMPMAIAIYGTENVGWDSVEKLKNHLSTKNKYRTKFKQENIVDALLDVVTSKNMTIDVVLHRLVQKLYKDHFHLRHRDSEHHSSKEEKINFIEGNEYFEHLERFCISFIDAVKREASHQGLHPSYLFSRYHDKFGPQNKRQRVYDEPSNIYSHGSFNSGSYNGGYNGNGFGNIGGGYNSINGIYGNGLNPNLYNLDAGNIGSALRGLNPIILNNNIIDPLSSVQYKNSIRNYDRIDNKIDSVIDLNSHGISNNNAIVQALMRISADKNFDVDL